MRITEIKVLNVVGDEKLKAYVTIKLDDCFVVRDLKVIKGASGYFVAMPAKRMKDGTYRDLAHPLDKPTRLMFESEVMNEYMRVKSASEKESEKTSEKTFRLVGVEG
jgi:stage V sporulation protein G